MANMLLSPGRRLDRFFSGHWYWRLRLRGAERHLEKALDSHGDQSTAARRATEQYSQVRFAVQFGRTAPSWERVAVQKAVDAGHRIDDLRLVVLNREFTQPNGLLSVRRIWPVVALAWTLKVISFTQWAVFSTLTLAILGASWRTILTIGSFTIVYWVLWRGLSLYTTRPLAAGKRIARALDLTPIKIASADVIQFSQRGTSADSTG